LDRLIHVVDVNEAAAVLHIPRSSLIPIPGMQMQSHRQLRPPSDLSETGTVIGQYHEHGITKPIHISEIDRTRHTYVIGQTGTGKSTVIKSMVLDDILKGRGVCVVDPHGDLVNDIMAQIPAERVEDVIVIDPTQTDASIGLNLFEYETQEEREMAIQLFQKIVELVERARGTPMKFMGPQFMQHLRNNAYWVTQDRNDPGTIIELYNMYAIKDFYKRWLPLNEQDAKLKIWHITMKSESYHARRDGGSTNFSYFSSKFEDFVFDSRIRAIFGQKHSTFNFFDAMNTRKIILINLSRGLMSEIASAFMGGVIMAKLQQAALKRALLPAQQRSIFSVYVDEFQNYTSESFVSLLSESRKYGIALTLANQFLTQIKNERIIEAILGNVGTIISFRIGLHDGKALQPRFAPEVAPSDLINLPNWQAYVSTQVSGQSRRPFSMQTIRPRDTLDQQTYTHVLTLSKQQYARPRSEVERILAQSMLLNRTAARKETLPTHHITLATHPIPHEISSSDASVAECIATHGCGLSLWHYIDQVHPSYTLMHIGMHARLQQQVLDVPLDELVPVQQRLGSAYAEFSSWMHNHRVHTLRDALTLLRYQQSINEHTKPVVSYCNALIAYQMHQSRPEQPWHAVALTNVLAAALDAQQRAWIWGTSPSQIAHVVDGVCALVGCEFQLFLRKTDGTVWRVSRDSITVVPGVHSITHLSGGQHCVAAIDAHGQVHLIYEHDENAKRIGTIPPHTAVQLVAVGFDHVIAYNATQQFVSWGGNDHDSGVIPAELAATSVPIVALAAGYNRSFAIDANGHLYAWGNHAMTKTTLHTLNVQKVQSIACYGKQFICCTANGTWWHNNQPLTFAPSMAPQSIIQIVGNYSGSWLAIRHAEAIPTWIALMNQDIKEIEGLNPAITSALRDIGINTISDLCPHTHTQLIEYAYFVEYPTHLDALIAAIHTLCNALRLPKPWPMHAYTINDLAPGQHHYCWYMQHLTPHRQITKTRSDNDDDIDRLFNDLLRDMDD
ncbi:MAG: helicase HerA domain-containing protein, partial [Roseiflexaceae bacterium]